MGYLADFLFPRERAGVAGPLAVRRGAEPAVEAEQASLKAEMESADFYKAGTERIAAVMARADAAGRELEELVARWMELEERR